MIALLTGVISESMFEKNQVKLDEERHEREAKRKILNSRFKALFDTADKNDNDEASAEELRKLLPQVEKDFNDYMVSYTKQDLDCVIDVMDADASGFISEVEFCQGIMSIADGVRAMSIQELYYAVSLIKSKTEKNELVVNDTMRRCVALNEKLPPDVVARFDVHRSFRSVRRTQRDSQTLRAAPVVRPEALHSMTPGWQADSEQDVVPIPGTAAQVGDVPEHVAEHMLQRLRGIRASQRRVARKLQSSSCWRQIR